MGNPKLANTILVGMLSRELQISEDVWRSAIAKSVKPSYLASNLAAFDFGRGIDLQSK
jgi:indolepyruvate ferredoxin oxidoreductase beta subunit